MFCSQTALCQSSKTARSMFDFVRDNTRWLMIILTLMIVPSFVFIGVQGYSSMQGGQSQTVATVAGQKITQQEWDAAHQEQAQRLSAQMRGAADKRMLDSPAFKRQVLDKLIRERVLLVASVDLGLQTTDERLQRVFTSDPQFESYRNANGSLNKDTVNLPPAVFTERLRQELSRSQVEQALVTTALSPSQAASAALGAFFQQREVQIQRFEPKDQLAKVNPSEADLEAYYRDPAHRAAFKLPEQITLEYVVLDADALQKDVSVSEETLRKTYAENAARFTAPEERRASHILIKAEKEASAADIEKAKAKAQALLAEIQKKPEQFAELARKNSQDPGSAEKGGDLDFFGRGAMVKPFEDAAFSLKPGQISEVVRSDFGFHIIQLTAARGGEKKPFEAVRAELETQARQEAAQKRFTELAQAFGNTAEEMTDSLKPLADQYKLPLQTAKDVQRTPAAGVTGVLANPKFLEALFNPESLSSKRNTDVIEISPKQIATGRVVQYAAAREQKLAEVREQVKERVRLVQAAELARQAGEARLKELKASASKDELNVPTITLSRLQPPEGVSADLLNHVLKAADSPLPAWLGTRTGPGSEAGYALVKLIKVKSPDMPASEAQQARNQYSQTWADAERQAYEAALKKRFKAEVSKAVEAAASQAPGGSS
jgi:peptidyl-prolyl cis-trans isomerase D